MDESRAALAAALAAATFASALATAAITAALATASVSASVAPAAISAATFSTALAAPFPATTLATAALATSKSTASQPTSTKSSAVAAATVTATTLASACATSLAAATLSSAAISTTRPAALASSALATTTLAAAFTSSASIASTFPSTISTNATESAGTHLHHSLRQRLLHRQYHLLHRCRPATHGATGTWAWTSCFSGPRGATLDQQALDERAQQIADQLGISTDDFTLSVDSALYTGYGPQRRGRKLYVSDPLVAQDCPANTTQLVVTVSFNTNNETLEKQFIAALRAPLSNATTLTTASGDTWTSCSNSVTRSRARCCPRRSRRRRRRRPRSRPRRLATMAPSPWEAPHSCS